MNSNFRNLAIWVVIGLLLMALFNLFQNPGTSRRGNEISYSEFLAGVDAGNVSEVTIAKHRITGSYRDKSSGFTTIAPEDPNLVERLSKKGVKITARPPEEDVPSILGVLVNWFPMLLLIGVWIFFMRQMQSGGGRAMGFGKSKAKLLTERHGRVTFEDVAGVDEAKSDLQEIVEFLRDPQKFQRLGGRIPRGALLVGPPGTGKTLLARAIAGEANVPFFTISGSDFVEMFVGVGASRVRDMFDQAKKNAPCIIFIDEIDAVGRHRGAGLGGGNDEREQTLNQLLVEMDGFEANEGIILIAATNRPDVLDPALLRPGRFDRQIVVPNPDVAGREKILRVHMRKVPLAPDVDAKTIARGTPGFSGADLANLVNEAALLAARRNKRLVTQQEFEDSKDKVMMGAERRSMVMTDEEKKLTAYHEAGHALVMLNVKGHEPLHKVTIIPRGRALGVTMWLPERDRYSQSRTEIEAVLASLFGGRVVEELIFGIENVTTGAASDIKMATNMARRMVTEYGFSDKLGPLRYSENEEEVFLGYSVTQRKNISDATAKVIDEEIRRMVEQGEATARGILTERLAELHILAKG
ncbi:MAG TPA: ATP-dependent zinc metalloprotease FtsH, partial [Hyphomicrobiaceae bacterium]|nr:ATP-dependent zinc metalloprotease FtsH [Hyphomicrobiaceae bacterium]